MRNLLSDTMEDTKTLLGYEGEDFNIHFLQQRIMEFFSLDILSPYTAQTREVNMEQEIASQCYVEYLVAPTETTNTKDINPSECDIAIQLFIKRNQNV